MPNELHPAAFVEEPLQDDRVLRGKGPQRGEPGPEIAHDHVGGVLVDPTFLLQPAAGAVRVAGQEMVSHLHPKIRDFL